MEEVVALAIKKGIVLKPKVIQKTFERAMSFPPDTTSSLQLDIHQKKKGHELELIAGTIINLGVELGIETPRTRQIYNDLIQMIKNNQ